MSTLEKSVRRGRQRAILGLTLLAFPLAACGPIAFSDDSALVIVGNPPPPPPPPEPEPEPEPPKPKHVTIKGDRLEIDDKIQFEYNKADIKEESHELLNDIVSTLKEHEEIQEMSIEGHTDSDGKAKYNKKLSQSRADSVKQYLVDAGIDEARLVTKGWGEEKPIADNKTDEGKETNRRVEFLITKQAEVEYQYEVDPKTGEKKKVGKKVKKGATMEKPADDAKQEDK